jgi:hypothetical protein
LNSISICTCIHPGPKNADHVIRLNLSIQLHRIQLRFQK